MARLEKGRAFFVILPIDKPQHWGYFFRRFHVCFVRFVCGLACCYYYPL